MIGEEGPWWILLVITIGTHLVACYVYICLNQEVKRGPEARSWRGYINLKAYPQLSHLFQLVPMFRRLHNLLKGHYQPRINCKTYEPVGDILYPTPQIRACVLVACLHSPAPALRILRRKQTHYKISSNVLKAQFDEHAHVQMCTCPGLSNRVPAFTHYKQKASALFGAWRFVVCLDFGDRER